MKAMILAAGLGTRLRPLTGDRPKALVEIAGRSMLELALCRMRAFGIREVLVNTHHFADLMADYLKAHGNFGMRIEISREELLLDTGGGLKKAAGFFLETPDTPFLLHNVDVLSSIDFGDMLRAHARQGAIATLAVQQRETSRYLLFDENGLLCGRQTGREGKPEWARPCRRTQPLAFAGIHVISPRIFALMRDEGVFSIIPAYLQLAAQGEKIAAFRADGYYWRDLGRPDSVAQAERDMESGVYPQI